MTVTLIVTELDPYAPPHQESRDLRPPAHSIATAGWSRRLLFRGLLFGVGIGALICFTMMATALDDRSLDDRYFAVVPGPVTLAFFLLPVITALICGFLGWVVGMLLDARTGLRRGGEPANAPKYSKTRFGDG